MMQAADSIGHKSLYDSFSLAINYLWLCVGISLFIIAIVSANAYIHKRSIHKRAIAKANHPAGSARPMSNKR